MKAKDPLERANKMAVLITVLAVTALPLGLFQLPSFPYLGLRPDPLSGGKGYEPFAVEVVLMMQGQQGGFWARKLTPLVWNRVAGPAQRTRVYARALTEAPILPVADWEWVMSQTLNEGQSKLSVELDLPSEVQSMTLSLKSLTPGREATWLLEPTR